MAQSTIPGLEGRPQVEKCLFVNSEVELPISLLEDVNVFMEVMSLQTWQSELSEGQKRHLIQFLPSFPKGDMQEKQVTLRKVFAGENLKFGTPLRQFHFRLKEGSFSPDIARYAALCRKAKMREYRYQQQVYYSNLLKDILVNRQRLLEQVYQTPVDEPLQLRVSQYVPPSRDKQQSLPQRVQSRYARILQEVNEECGGETSDEEEASSSGEGQASSSQPLCRPLFPDSPTETLPSTVTPTFAPKPPTMNGGTVPRPRPRSPIEVTEDDFRELVIKHRKRKAERELHPELDTRSVTLPDILSRAMPNKKVLCKATAGTGNLTPALLKKKLKEKSEKKKKKLKIKEEEPDEGSKIKTESPMAIGTAVVGSALPMDESAMDGMEVKDETDAPPPPVVATAGSASQATSELPAGSFINFFSLLRDFICEDQDGKITTTKLEERVKEWQETIGITFSWFNEQSAWVELVAPALKFLSGDVLGLTLENFIPLLDYKERAQQWKWIGRGRDSDEQLHPLCRHWLENKDEAGLNNADGQLSSPPAPKTRTSFVVRPTNDEEKGLFQSQECQRFGQPHRAFTYQLHGYSSVVGPVKGVYAKEGTMNKARDHVLLIKDRPPYVTILTLVRDAAARLPNGEGTRGDICELLKDSKFLAPGVTDAQINNVVSGALDRLHYEKDPCVKYDVNRKLWIYLHRNRTEDEFEKIHQAQGAAAKAKKALQKPKPAKKIKESVQSISGSNPSAAPPDSPLRIEPPSPSGASVSPRAQAVSPRTPQASPRAAHSPKQPATPNATTPTTPKQQQSPKVAAVSSAASPAATASPHMASPHRAAASAHLLSGKAVTTVTSQATTTTNIRATSAVATGQTVVSLPTSGPVTVREAAAAAQVSSHLGLTQQLGKAGGGVAVIGGAGTTKPLSLTFLQPSGKVGTSSPSPAPGTPPVAVAGSPASKPLAFSLIQSPVGNKMAAEAAAAGQPQPQAQTRTVVLTSKGETIGQKLLLTQQQHQQLQHQQHLQQLQQLQQQQQQQQQQHAASLSAAHTRPVISSPKPQKTPSPATTPSSPVTLVTTAVKGSSTKVVQQVAPSSPQVVSVSNMGLASMASLQKQIASSHGTTIKIQGGSILQSSGSKPLTIQRMTSLEGADMKGGQVILQRAQSVETSEASAAASMLQQHVGPGSPQLTLSRQGGKPATLVFTKPGSSIAGKPANVSTVSGSLAAQLIQTTSIGGKPITFGGKPIIIGGKPMHLSGKPFQIGGKPVHLIGKPGGGQIGVIQGQGGVMSALNIVTQASSGASTVASLTNVPQARLVTTPTATAPTLVGQILQSGGAVVQAGRSGGTTVSASKSGLVSAVGSQKVLSPGTGVVVTQLAPAGVAQSKPGTPTSQPKLVTAAGQASVLGHQILVAPGSAPGKMVNAQQILAAAGGGMRPALLTRSPGGKPGGNIQVVKTMLSQASGGKPGQTTIVLAQPGGQQVSVSGVEQLTQAGVKTVPASSKTKGGPVYARIITPPPGIRLAAVRPGTTISSMPGVSMLQAVGARFQTTNPAAQSSDPAATAAKQANSAAASESAETSK